MAKLKLTLVKSLIGRLQKHKDTISALGLRRINHSVVKEDVGSIRGMVARVDYLLKVEEISE